MRDSDKRTRPPKPAYPQRPRELQDTLNHHLYHPLAWRLALLLSRTPLTPNMVSVIGACFVMAAGFSYAQPGWPAPALIGMALHMSWHVVDGADGDLARITGRASPIGEMVDGLCDYGSHLVLYLVLGWLLAAQIGLLGWLLMLAGSPLWYFLWLIMGLNLLLVYSVRQQDAAALRIIAAAG